MEIEVADIRENKKSVMAEMLFERYLATPAIVSLKDIELLKELGYISKEVAIRKEEEAKEAREALVIKNLGPVDRAPLSIAEYMQRIPLEVKDRWAGQEIHSSYWKPKAPDDFEPDFVAFINNTHERFCDILPYEKFYLYMKQAYDWLDDERQYEDCDPGRERDLFVADEVSRCKVNSMYFADKYGYIKESLPDPRGRKFKSRLPHAFIMFLCDQGRAFWAAKGRQMAFTSTMGLVAINRMNTNSNYAIKFVAQSDQKSKKIFEEKIKHSFKAMPKWLQCKLINDRDNWFRIEPNSSTSKNTKNTEVSSIEVVPPREDAANGGSDNLVLMDEQEMTELFSDMMVEAVPMMKALNPETDKREMMRSIIAWSTGGVGKGGKGSYAREFKSQYAKWRDGDFSRPIIPLVFDWTCIPGMDVEEYEKNKKGYAAGSAEGMSDLSMEERETAFRIHHPQTIHDCFVSSTATVVPISFIRKHELRARTLIMNYQQAYNRPFAKRGRFVPIHGTIAMPPEHYYKYNVIGVQFVPSDDFDTRAPVTMLDEPRKWDKRYFQGTDPIEQARGTSKMASVIWDAQFGAIVCAVNYRPNDEYMAFEQAALMGMYYRWKDKPFCPELVENDKGKVYMAWKGSGWAERAKQSLVPHAILPDTFRSNTTGHDTGLRMSGPVKERTVQVVRDVILTFGDNLNLVALWEQLTTFVSTTTGASVKYKVDDEERNQDDLIMATGISYICRLCYQNLKPVELKVLEARDQRPRRIQRWENGQIRDVLVPRKTTPLQIQA